MHFIFLFSLILVVSCQTNRKRNISSKIEPDEQVEKVDSSSLSVSLQVGDYQSKKFSGIFLKPKLDPNASFIAYEICSLRDPTIKCLEGKIDGLSQSEIFNAPNGKIKINYQACLIKERALKEPCGEKKSLLFDHMLENVAPPYLALAGGVDLNTQIQEKVQAILQDLNEYATRRKRTSPVQDSFDILVENEMSMNPLALGRFLRSPSFKKFLHDVDLEVQKYNSDLGLTDTSLNRGLAVLALGSPILAGKFFERWKEDEDFKDEDASLRALQESLTNMKDLGLEAEETIESLVSILLNSAIELSLELDPSRKILLKKIANIEKQIIQLMNQAQD
jgi:hypothetical protein